MSLRLRLGIASLAVSLVFLGLVGVVLDSGFREAVRQGAQERLQARVYTLLGVMEVASGGQLELPTNLPEARFSSPASGLYARVLDAQAHTLWRSSSLVGTELPSPAALAAGEQRFEHRPGLFLLHFGLEWEDDDGRWWPFTLDLAETDAGYQAQVDGFRRRLWVGLGAVGLALLVAQLLVFGWGLRPLSRVRRELAAIQSGGRDRLGGGYPRELAQLTGHINRFIEQQQSRRERYRDSLGDLAHSLKTPMAVLTTALERGQSDAARDQIKRMREIVDYQLGRAGAVGTTPLTGSVSIAQVAASVKASLDKVHAARGIRCTLGIDDGVGFRGDRGDLLELLGNLLDNAYKWADSRVVVSAAVRRRGDTNCLTLRIEDDGPGIAADEVARLLLRGERGELSGDRPGDRIGGQLDKGHGIGLAVVREVAAVYGGEVLLGRGELGGLRIQLDLPGATTSTSVHK